MQEICNILAVSYTEVYIYVKKIFVLPFICCQPMVPDIPIVRKSYLHLLLFICLYHIIFHILLSMVANLNQFSLSLSLVSPCNCLLPVCHVVEFGIFS